MWRIQTRILYKEQCLRHRGFSMNTSRRKISTVIFFTMTNISRKSVWRLDTPEVCVEAGWGAVIYWAATQAEIWLHIPSPVGIGFYVGCSRWPAGSSCGRHALLIHNSPHPQWALPTCLWSCLWQPHFASKKSSKPASLGALLWAPQLQDAANKSQRTMFVF